MQNIGKFVESVKICRRGVERAPTRTVNCEKSQVNMKNCRPCDFCDFSCLYFAAACKPEHKWRRLKSLMARLVVWTHAFTYLTHFSKQKNAIKVYLVVFFQEVYHFIRGVDRYKVAPIFSSVVSATALTPIFYVILATQELLKDISLTIPKLFVLFL